LFFQQGIPLLFLYAFTFLSSKENQEGEGGEKEELHPPLLHRDWYKLAL